jgi:hypothetical protein
MKDFGKNRQKATVVNVTPQLRTLKNSIGGTDRTDFIRFNLASRSSIQVTLNKLKANADLTLLNSAGKIVQQSKRKGKKNEAIAATLEAGNYFLKITPGRPNDRTQYRLQLSAISANTAPILMVNLPFSIIKGTPGIFNGSLLKANDVEQNASQLVYTLTRLPEAGLLKLNGTVLRAGSTFTQTDIEAGRLVYNSFGRSQSLDSRGANPAISGSNVVWQGEGGGSGIFFFNGSTTTQLTKDNNPGDFLFNEAPQISGSNVVWQGEISTTAPSDIFLFNGSSTTQLTRNGFQDFNPQISGSNVVWFGRDSSDDTEIFFFNGSNTLQLTNNNTNDFSPQISGSNVVWFSTDGDSDTEIFLFNGTNTTQLTNNNTDDSEPVISGSNVACSGHVSLDSGGGPEVFFFNGSSILQLTNNSTSDFSPKISGSNVVWYGTNGGGDTEIFFFNGTNTTQLTNNNTDDSEPVVSGCNVAWSGKGGIDGGGDTEIFFFNGSSTTQLTLNNNTDNAVKISGSNFTWRQIDDSSISQIFFGNGALSDRFDFTIADGAGGTASGVFNLTLS